MVTPVEIPTLPVEAMTHRADRPALADRIIPGISIREMRSADGCDYRIFVWTPTPKPATGPSPVLYLLDGNVTFPIAAAATAAQSRRPEITGVQPSVVVGIGYPGAAWLDPDRRTFDYTPLLVDSLPPRRPDDRPWPSTGGADRFLDFVESDVKPWIESEFDVDPARSAIFGHSFGGLFVLHTLFTRTALFKNYIAASPSIWFGGESLQAEMIDFISARGAASRRNLLVTVGGLEQGDDASGQSGSGHNAWLKRNRMVDNARELAAKLSGMEPSMLRVSFNAFEGENHASVVPAAISRALRFALGAGQ